MNAKWVCLFICALLGLCASAFVDTLTKCSYKDDACVAGSIKNLLKSLSESGVPEYNLPRVDPLDIKNVMIPVLGLFNMNAQEGQIKGIKDCVINNAHNDLDKGVTDVDVTCDLSAKAKLSLDDIGPSVQKLTGQSSSSGNADVNVKIDKLHLKIKFSFDIIKKEDGDIYIKCTEDDFKYDFDIGNFEMTESKIILGDQDISEFVQTFMNQNWKTIIPTIGKGTLESSMKILNKEIVNFFDAIPVKNYYSDDLSSYVNN